MIKNFSKTISVFLFTILIFCFLSSFAFSQQSLSPSNLGIKGISKSVFESHFSRADREFSPDRWHAEAKLGLSQAIYVWEITAGNLYDNQFLLNEAKTELEKWSNEELEKRFSQWLMNRFFGEAAEKILFNFLLTLEDTQKKYSWHLDDEGNIIFDDKTGDPLVIRPFEDGRNFSFDLILWNSEVRGILENSGFLFDNALLRLYPELLLYIPEESRETMTGIIIQAADGKSSAIKREFENIAEREERIFTNRRTRDIWSLRNKSENEAARLFTERLITETENACNAGIEELNIRIEQAAAGAGDLAILGEEWLRLYKEQFDRGLKAWEEAEERFFIRRIEWEQESFRLFSEGEETWYSALRQFEEEKQKWELKAKELFQAGEMLFVTLSEDFEKKIEKTKKEFELNMAMRIGEGTERVKALIDMYLICSSAAVSSMENINLWHNQYSMGNKANPKDSDFSVWLNNEIKKNPHNVILSEIKKSYDMHLSYIDKALDARERIIDNYSELLGTGTLKDILSPDASSGDFCLDEYQIALVRAKALVLYWERKTIIADAVMNYAGELSAGRMTEAEGLRLWENARNDYNESLLLYETELNKLYSIGEDIRKQQEALDNLSLMLKKDEEKLNQLNYEYKTLISVSAVNNGYFYLMDINIKYNSLSELYNMLMKTGKNASYAGIPENGIKWRIAEQREASEEILTMLYISENLSEEEKNALYNEYVSLGPQAQEEIRRNTFESLSILFVNYGFDKETGLMPNVNNICDLLFSDSGNFIKNTVNFLLEFDNCFTEIPQWLEYELSLWKNAFIQYTAAYAFNKNLSPEKSTAELALEYERIMSEYSEFNYSENREENNDNEPPEESSDPENTIENPNNDSLRIIKNMQELYYMSLITGTWENIHNASERNEKHWRQFLNYDYLTNINPLIIPAFSWSEGITADVLFNAVYYSNRINDSFDLYSRQDLPEANEDSAYYHLIYSNEVSNADSVFGSLNYYYNDIVYSAEAYELSKLSPEETNMKLSAKKDELILQENIYSLTRNEYFLEAGKFLDIGSLYDLQYGILKIAQENTEQKRFEYEKQDAIQRWASTAYLNTDNIDPENNRIKLTRAQTVLNILSDLYNDEYKRSYNNSEYDKSYAAYEDAFSRKLNVLEAVESILSSSVQEYNNNAKIYSEYKDSLNRLGNIEQNFSISSANRGEWSLNDIITVKDGRIVFSRDDSMKLNGVNEHGKNALDNFFDSKIIPGNEQFEITLYENSLRELSQRMSGYFSDSKKYIQWSLARDYLITSLINANGDLKFLNDYYSGLGEMGSNGSLHSLYVKKNISAGNSYLYSEIRGDSIFSNSGNMFLNAWNTLSDTEREDLEYYVILTLSGNNYFSGFSQVYTLNVYNHAYNYANSKYREAKSVTDKWYLFFISWLWFDMRDINKNTANRIYSVLKRTNEKVNEWNYGLQENLSTVLKQASEYAESCNKLSVFEVINTASSGIGWSEINHVISNNKSMNSEKAAILESYWELMRENSKTIYTNVSEALAGLVRWVRDEEEKARNSLDLQWNMDKQKQEQNELIFQAAADAYINGTVGIETLISTVNNAYGENAAAWKNHYNNMHTLMMNDLSIYMETDNDFHSEFNSIGDKLIKLAEKTLENRYYSELKTRETEWYYALKDINDKFLEWQAASMQILEYGRADWIACAQKMEEAYKQWNLNFQNEYERVSNEWAHVYLAGLEDKERWLKQAEDAANQASLESFLSLIGTEGERLSRFIDIREPFGIRDALPQTRNILADLLRSSGIINLSNAFGSINNLADISSVIPERRTDNMPAWNTALIKIAASDMAKQVNIDVADNEARRLAYSTREIANEAVRNLAEQVNLANQSFNESMDDIFIYDGLWRKSGKNYIKDIIKGSTVFSPVITEKVTVTGYESYKMEPVSYKTNLDDNHLAALDSTAIRGLIENILAEIDNAAGDIFGFGKEQVNIEKNGKTRTQSPGKFGAHIGYSPADKLSENPGKTRKEIFYDEGYGELGRLMTEFTYWYVIDSMGLAEYSLAPWDKRLWDDSGSWFKAPSIRSAVEFTTSIVAVAASVATGGASLGLLISINTSSELAFGVLDVSFGYKKIDEAAFDVGKTLLTNTVTGALSGGFSSLSQGLSASASTINQIVNKTLMSGLQTAATNLAATLISGFNYSSAGGFSYDTDMFRAGLKNAGINSLVSMTGTFTTTGLTAINSGLDLSKLIGYNPINKIDLGNLNNLLGSLAGQGINVLMGNDFSLNILNINQFKGAGFSSGLLELNLGKEGMKMNIGSGGADVSFNNMVSAINGAAVWNVNNRIFKYGNENDFTALVSLRAQYGYGDNTQKSQLWDILNGNTLLNTGADGDFYAQTAINDGQRVINLTEYQNDMSIEEQFRLAVTLGHEAYRDGYETADNYNETRTATMAHTEMALRMALSGEKIAYNDNLENDISAYIAALVLNDTGFFNSYVDSNYDSAGDYWKLVLQNGIAGFEWDGELTYDLSLLGLENRAETLDEDVLRAVWNLGSNYGSFDDFKSAVGAFNVLNSVISAFERTFNATPKDTETHDIFSGHWNSFIIALRNVGASGLLAETAAEIMKLNGGPHVFANGEGEITSDYGIRIINWGSDAGKYQWHNAWDLGARGTGNTRIAADTRLVAPMDGALSFEFNQGHGIQLVIKGGNNESITYSHSHALSLRKFVELYSYNSIDLYGNSLTGIVQNMVVGIMGNTGNLSVDPHVDLIYRKNGVTLNPALFFYKDENSKIFPSTDYSVLMSGLSSVNDPYNVNLTRTQINGIYNFYNNYNDRPISDFMNLVQNTNNKDELISVLNQRLRGRRM